MLPISSRKSVPPSASSKQPMRSVFASVNAPFTWPNSSLSNTPSDERRRRSPRRSGRAARGEAAWSQRATTSLPVPCSPVMSTFASEGATRSISRSTGLHRGGLGDQLGRARSRRSSWFSVSSRWRAPQRPAQLHLRAQRGEQARVVPRLLDVVARARGASPPPRPPRCPRPSSPPRAAWRRAPAAGRAGPAPRGRRSCRARSSGPSARRRSPRASSAASTAGGRGRASRWRSPRP